MPIQQIITCRECGAEISNITVRDGNKFPIVVEHHYNGEYYCSARCLIRCLVGSWDVDIVRLALEVRKE